MHALLSCYQQFVHRLAGLRHLDGLPPLLIRLYLAPVMLQAGWQKFSHFDDTVAWFGNADWGLGLPLPALMATLAASAELVGGVCLVFGAAVRWISIPLMVTMLVAVFAVHWPNGWLAIADPGSWLANDRVLEAAERLERGRAILREHGHYDWLTGRGQFVILNNGIEFAVTYFIMLFSLLYTGAGRYVSVDDWLRRWALKSRSV